MFNELPKSVDPIALAALIEKKTAERVPEKTVEILEVLKKDSNTTLSEIISKYVINEDAKIGLQDLETSIDANIWDNKDGQPVTTLSISTNENDATSQTVSQETYDSLKPFCVDINTFRAEIESQLEGKII